MAPIVLKEKTVPEFIRQVDVEVDNDRVAKILIDHPNRKNP